MSKNKGFIAHTYYSLHGTVRSDSNGYSLIKLAVKDL